METDRETKQRIRAVARKHGFLRVDDQALLVLELAQNPQHGATFEALVQSAREVDALRFHAGGIAVIRFIDDAEGKLPKVISLP